MEEVMLCTAAAGGVATEKEAEAVLLCTRLYAILARHEPREEEDVGVKPKEAAQWKVLRRKVQLAEAGKWHQLVDKLAEELRRSEASDEERRAWAREDAEDEGAARRRRRGVAIGKVKCDCPRTGAQLLRGQSMLPPCRATADAQKKLLVLETSAADDVHLSTELASARAAGSEPRARLRVLARWTQQWADGAFPPWVVATLQERVLRPPRKPNGKPRNISLMECVLKLASGIVQDVIREIGAKNGTGEGLHWSQYGGQPAGPELMLMVGQGMMNLKPDLAYVNLDGENAYGRMNR
ncbi:unnamed protein product, partial [Prorocentrum cordatum]